MKYNNSIFKNCGDMIQLIATIFFVIEVVACVIAGFALISTSCQTGYYSTYVNWPQIGIGFGVLLLGSFFAYFKCLLLTGFGQLISNTKKLADKFSDEKEISVTPIEAAPSIGTWKCEKCGSENTLDSKFCTRCGEKRPQSATPEASEGEWKCPNCGSINQNVVGTCGCGTSKPV